MALSLLGKTNKRVSESMETENFVREEFLSWSTICFGLSETWDHKYFTLFAINKNLLSTDVPFLKLNRNLKIDYNTSTKKHNTNSFLRKCSKFDSTEEQLRCVSLVVRKHVFGVSDQVRAVQPQKMARGLKFRIQEVEGLYFPYSENKGADQLRGYREADPRLCFRICKKPVFS